MKKLLLIILCCSSVAAFSQHKLYAKEFHGNKKAVYLTNSNSEGLAFLYYTPSDTLKTPFLIENFQPDDIKSIKEKVLFYKVKFYREGYVTKKGDLVFIITSENECIYFYHYADRDFLPDQIN